MSRMKTIFAALLLAATTVFVPSASAVVTSVAKVVIAGSSGVWQAVALGAFNYNGTNGSCPTNQGFTVHPPCFHYTDSKKFNLNDTRPTLDGLGGTTNVDTSDLWIIWDTATGSQKRNVWLYIKPDTIIANRCYFANPRCNITAPSPFPASGALISSTLWGADTTPPSDVQALFTGATGPLVNVLSSELRPEDALFEQCRVNSALGNGAGGGFGDGLDGLGYSPGPAGGAANPSGQCPAFDPTHSNLGQLVGQPIKSGISGSTSAAQVLAFNISGHDPFTNNTVLGATVLDVGAVPIVFVFSRSSTINSGLSGAADATDAELQKIFGGDNCDANELGLASAPIDVYLREPLSGTMTTTEMSVFRRPTKTVPPQAVLGESQEKGVGGNAGHNPLNNGCTAGGNRIRGIGTGEVVNGASGVGGVLGSGGSHNDGIAYSFYSFGNFSKLASAAGNPNYGYLTLDGQDGIGAGQFANQELPWCTVPCPENSASFPGWGVGNSFPALRAGKYTAWTLVHMLTNTVTVSLKGLIAAAQSHAVTDVPDFIPYTSTTTSIGTDPGMKIWLTHYQQRDGADNKLGNAPNNGTFSSGGNPVGGDKGGMAGGCTISTTGITATKDLEFIQANVTGSGATCTKDRD